MSWIGAAVGIGGALIGAKGNKDAAKAAAGATPEFAKQLQPTIDDTTKRLETSATDFYDGDRVAGFTPMQDQGFDMTGALSSALGQQAKTAAGGFQQFGSGANVNANPYLEQNINNLRSTALSDFERNQLPTISNTAIVDGGLGGTRQGVAQGIALSDLNRDLISQEGTMRQTQTNFDLGQQLQALINQGNILGGQGADSDLLLQRGGVQQDQNQSVLDADRAAYDEAYNRDLELLRILTGAPAGTPPIPQQTNPLVAGLGAMTAYQGLQTPQAPTPSPYIPGMGTPSIGPSIR